MSRQGFQASLPEGGGGVAVIVSITTRAVRSTCGLWPGTRQNPFGRSDTTANEHGAYQIVGADAPVFRPVAAPESSDLQQQIEQIAARIGRALERRGLIERDLENTWLAADTEAGRWITCSATRSPTALRSGRGRVLLARRRGHCVASA